MPLGSPGFVGARLREAREARQMTGASLSALVGITASGISSYEKGHNSPSPDALDRIAKALNFKIAFFLRPEENQVDSAQQTIFERSRSSTTKSTRKRAQHHRTWLREIVHYLAQFVRLPEPDVPGVPRQMPWLAISDRNIEEAARDTRRHWRLGDGPISDVTLLAEKHGIIATMIDMNANNLDAFSIWDNTDGRPYIVLGTDTQSAFRTRFNVCHEIGHLILHRDVSPSEFNDQRFFKIIESQADRFAAAFLTPATTFSPEISIPTLEVFRLLKPRWRTSIKMMIHRARELSVINTEEARRLYINYNRRGWNRSEPLDEECQLEEPRLVRKAFETIIEKSMIERSQVEVALPFNREDIERLSNLPYGYLDEDSAYTWALKELGSNFHNK